MNKQNYKRRVIIGSVSLAIITVLYFANWTWPVVPVVLLALVLAFWD